LSVKEILTLKSRHTELEEGLNKGYMLNDDLVEINPQPANEMLVTFDKTSDELIEEEIQAKIDVLQQTFTSKKLFIVDKLLREKAKSQSESHYKLSEAKTEDEKLNIIQEQEILDLFIDEQIHKFE
jgi:hypothetical protein